MKRRTHANPMRLLIMLAVMWAAGSLLFAAESSQRARTTPAAQTPATAAPAAAPAPGAEPAAGAADDTTVDAAEEDAGASEDASKAAQKKEARSEDDKEESESEKAGSVKPESAADAGASPRRFVPSEQVRADFDVSFPIDI